MVEQIVGFKTKLHVHVFSDGGLLIDGKVKLSEVGPNKGIPSLASEVHGVDAGRYGDSSAGCPGRRINQSAIRSGVACTIERAWDGKGCELQIVVRIVLMIDDGTNYVGPGKEFARAVVVVLKIVVQVEWLAGLNGDDSIYTPPVAKNFVTALRSVWKLIDKVPSDAVANVKIGVSAIKTVGCLAVIRLRRVGNVVFTVARIVNGMRPCVIEGGGEPVPVVDSEAGLKGIVN